MADATVPQPRREEALPLPDQRGIDQALVIPRRLPWLRIVLWTALVILLGAFLLMGTVRVGAGNWNGRRMRLSVIWERFLEFLASQGFSAPAVAVVSLAGFVALVGSAYLLWLAFGLRNEDPGKPQESAKL